jgi:hypothetical protein
MKRLAMVVVAGMAALLIVACGENAPKQPESKTEVIVEQPAAEASAPAAEAPASDDSASDSEKAAAADAQAQE